jgi:hypothetical protein
VKRRVRELPLELGVLGHQLLDPLEHDPSCLCPLITFTMFRDGSPGSCAW